MRQFQLAQTQKRRIETSVGMMTSPFVLAAGTCITEQHADPDRNREQRDPTRRIDSVRYRKPDRP